MKAARLAVVALVAATIGASAVAETPELLARSDLNWREMFPGVQFAPAYGDWEKGAHAKYVQIARTAQVPMHTHSSGYDAVVISGKMINIYEGGNRVELSSGDYFQMAAKRPHAHECVSEEPCFFYTHSGALWDIQVLEPQPPK